MQTTCASCGAVFEPGRKTQRFCSGGCRSRGNRGHLASVDGPEGQPEVVQGVTGATKARLVKVDRLETPLGQAALVLAQRIDAGRDTGAGLAALVKQHQLSLEAATANLTVADDPVDRLRLVVGERRGG